jgi:hypothetical protein
MYARAVDEAAASLRRLRREEWEDFALALLALSLALAAAEAHRALALPLFLGGLYVGGKGLGALWHRWDLVDRLSGDREAYSIAEIREYASEQATGERRRGYAALIRRSIRHRSVCDPRIVLVTDELEGLAAELEDVALTFDPASAVACRRLLTEPLESALLDSDASAEDLRASIRRIRLGFHDAG